MAFPSSAFLAVFGWLAGWRPPSRLRTVDVRNQEIPRRPVHIHARRHFVEPLGAALWIARDGRGPTILPVFCILSGAAGHNLDVGRERSPAVPEVRPLRRTGPNRVGEHLDVEPSDAADWREHHAALHEEINRLSRRDRTVFVLCELAGQPLDDVARCMGSVPPVLARRLARARRRLQARLSRRGYTIPVIELTAAFPFDGDRALPEELVEATVRAARRRLLGPSPRGRQWPLIDTLTPGCHHDGPLRPA